ncbi:MAG: ATP-binding protein [Bacteroidales bacterium]|jgi:predicted AAA+ superfamily ATPase|nr:ATP-binding protein [Bacteroidales bacterium]
MIPRQVYKLIQKRIDDKKVIIVLGPRQSGKTTLLEKFAADNFPNALWWNGDETDTRQFLKNPTSTILKSLIGVNKLLIIDEAQRIENIGLCIKLIYDNINGVKVIASGSSAFELANKINEPLTGRKWEYFLYPISYSEMIEYHGAINERRLFESRIIYGYYPDVLNNSGDEKIILQQLADSYLYKDILIWEKIQKPDRLEALVQALAYQLGNEVSFLELARITGLDKETVERYIILLERAFVVFRLRSFSRNHRSELKKSRKIYFYDNGLRNAIIKNFNPLGLRNDVGALWENFLMSERLKFLQYNEIFTNRYFWRTHSQQEIDYLEEREGKLFAYEFKWNINAKAKFSKTFTNTYPDNETQLITPANFEKFICS